MCVSRLLVVPVCPNTHRLDVGNVLPPPLLLHDLVEGDPFGRGLLGCAVRGLLAARLLDHNHLRLSPLEPEGLLVVVSSKLIVFLPLPGVLLEKPQQKQTKEQVRRGVEEG